MIFRDSFLGVEKQEPPRPSDTPPYEGGELRELLFFSSPPFFKEEYPQGEVVLTHTFPLS